MYAIIEKYGLNFHAYKIVFIGNYNECLKKFTERVVCKTTKWIVCNLNNCTDWK